MARPLKETVDFFPHYVKAGRTIFILESKFGNDGYAFWFKLLEILGESEGHSYDCSNSANWAFLLARTRCDEQTAEGIIQTLIDLGKIDSELWGKRIIWVQHLVDNLSDVYRRRQAKIPQKPDCGKKKALRCKVNDNGNRSNAVFPKEETPKEEKSRVKKRREENNDAKDCIANPDYAAFLDWEEKNAPTVRQMKEPITEEQFLRLKEEYGTSFMCDMFLQMHNWKPLLKKCQSANLTFRNWAKRDGHKPAQKGSPALGAGEFITPDGRRTYGTGTATIPVSAPPRPSEKHAWDAATAKWILL